MLTLKRMMIIALLGMFIAACAQPQTKTEKGAYVGTATGAAAGALLGQAIGGNTKGTLIGAGAGALIGGLAGAGIGRYMDNQEAALRQQLAASDAANVRRDANVLAVTFKSDFAFDVDSSTLKAGAYNEVNRVAQVLVQYPQTNIMVAGHTDSTGSEDYNQTLSERRAMSVKNALVGQGVSPERVTTIGYGESQPIADNGTAAGRQMNRRVVITIMPIEGANY